jgi:hypothetical protein
MRKRLKKKKDKVIEVAIKQIWANHRKMVRFFDEAYECNVEPEIQNLINKNFVKLF